MQILRRSFSSTINNVLFEFEHYSVNTRPSGSVYRAFRLINLKKSLIKSKTKLLLSAPNKSPKPSTMADGPEQCDHCGTTSERLSTCSRCQEARYCSKECQAAHYPVHKAPCKATAKVREAQYGPIIYYFNMSNDDNLWAIPDCIQRLYAVGTPIADA